MTRAAMVGRRLHPHTDQSPNSLKQGISEGIFLFFRASVERRCMRSMDHLRGMPVCCQPFWFAGIEREIQRGPPPSCVASLLKTPPPRRAVEEPDCVAPPPQSGGGVERAKRGRGPRIRHSAIAQRARSHPVFAVHEQHSGRVRDAFRLPFKDAFMYRRKAHRCRLLVRNETTKDAFGCPIPRAAGIERARAVPAMSSISAAPAYAREARRSGKSHEAEDSQTQQGIPRPRFANIFAVPSRFGSDVF
jgi:hypothetical protein